MKINLKHKILVIGFIYISLLFTGLAAFAQDPQFSQYYASPLYLNPGFTGTTDMQRVAANSRFQWTQLKSPFVTHSVSYDVAVPSLNSGFGVIAMTDKAGSANLSTTTIGGLYSAKIQLSKNWMVSPGLNFSYGSRGIDFDKLLFGDQIEFNGPTIDDAISVNRSDSQYRLGSRNGRVSSGSSCTGMKNAPGAESHESAVETSADVKIENGPAGDTSL